MNAESPVLSRSLATDTLVLHGGSFRHDPATSATTVPIYQSTSFDFPDTATAVKIVNFEQIEPLAEFPEREEFPVFHIGAAGQAGAGLRMATRRI